MIVGIGADIVRVERMAHDIERFGERFAARILTDSEFEEYRQQRNKAAFLARRFAAKEAAAKAMGTGFRDGMTLRDIGVAHDAHGRPHLLFTGRAAAWTAAQRISDVHVSLADETDHAVAFVILEGSREG